MQVGAAPVKLFLNAAAETRSQIKMKTKNMQPLPQISVSLRIALYKLCYIVQLPTLSAVES